MKTAEMISVLRDAETQLRKLATHPKLVGTRKGAFDFSLLNLSAACGKAANTLQDAAEPNAALCPDCGGIPGVAPYGCEKCGAADPRGLACPDCLGDGCGTNAPNCHAGRVAP